MDWSNVRASYRVAYGSQHLDWRLKQVVTGQKEASWPDYGAGVPRPS